MESLTAEIGQAGLLAPLLGPVAGAALTVTPVSWPSLPAVVALVGPARAAAREHRPAAVKGPRGFAVVLGFVIGMDGVVATLSAGFVGILVVLTRAAVVLNVVAVVLLTCAAVRLLRASGPTLCRRLEALPPDPLRAVSAGVLFSVSGCPGCAPVAAVGAAAAAAGGRTVACPRRPAQGPPRRPCRRRRPSPVRLLLRLAPARRTGRHDAPRRRRAAPVTPGRTST